MSHYSTDTVQFGKIQQTRTIRLRWILNLCNLKSAGGSTNKECFISIIYFIPFFKKYTIDSVKCKCRCEVLPYPTTVY